MVLPEARAAAPLAGAGVSCWVSWAMSSANAGPSVGLAVLAGSGQSGICKASHNLSTRPSAMPTMAESAGDPCSARLRVGNETPNSFQSRMRAWSFASTPMPSTVRETPFS